MVSTHDTVILIIFPLVACRHRNTFSLQLPVPREAVGIIIGKGGEQIKNIQAKFNVRIQFQNDDGGSQRMCDITGVADAMYAAKQHIQELIQENAVRNSFHPFPHKHAPSIARYYPVLRNLKGPFGP